MRSDSKYPTSEWTIDPGRSWGPLQLGMPLDAVTGKLNEQKIEFEYIAAEDPCYLDIPDFFGYCLFEQSNRGYVLVQIASYRHAHTMEGQDYVDTPLQEVLAGLGISEVSDTQWSCQGIDEGVYQPPDEELQNASKSTPGSNEELLKNGALWIKSLGVGLQLDHGNVECVAIREPSRIPSSNLGGLTPDQIDLAMELQEREEEDSNSTSKALSTTRKKHRWWTYPLRMIATLGAIGYFAYIINSVPKFHEAMKQAPTVEGTVVAKEPPGPFPEKFTVEYQIPNQPVQSITFNDEDITNDLKPDQATVELRYLPGKPEAPMTMTQVYSYRIEQYVPHFLIVGFVYFFGMIFLSIFTD